MAPRILVAGGGTGGHLYPALNLATALRRQAPGCAVTYVGARRGLEARVLPGRGLPYRLLPMRPLHRSRPWRNWATLRSTPEVLRGLRELFAERDPHLVVGTGGYAAGPPVLWARLSGRATALQEQNAAPGVVTRVMARWVDQVHLGFPEARERISPGRRTRVFAYGNPVTPALAAGELAPDPDFDAPGRVLLVAGGSQGARGLNQRWLEDVRRVRVWPDDLRVVWVTGPERAAAVEEAVGETAWADRIRVRGYVPDLGARLPPVSVAVCRAGAMFLSELAAAGVPAVLVPYPAAAGGHQLENARRMAEAGAAVVREEAGLEPGELWKAATRILADEPRREAMARSARSRGRPDAALRVAAELLRLARTRSSGRGGGHGEG